MARFVNETGSVLISAELGPIGPGEFEWPDFDPEVHGSGIPGCRPVDKPARKDAGKNDGAGSGTGDGKDGGDKTPAGKSNDDAGAGSQEK